MKKLLLSVLLTVAFAVPAFSQMMDMPMNDYREGRVHMDNREGWGHMMEMGNMDSMGYMMDMCVYNADKIGLTDDQVMKIKPIRRDMQKKQAQFKADLKIAQIELIEIMDVKDFDMEKATVAVKKIGDIETANHLAMLKSMQDVQNILTDEQFKKMKKIMPMMPIKQGEKKPAKKTMKKQ